MSSRPFRGGRRGRGFFPRGGGFRGRFNSRGGGRNKRFEDRSERTYYKDKYKPRSRSRSRSRSTSRSRSRSISRSRSRSSSRSRSRSQHRDSRSRKYPSKKELQQLAQSVNDAIANKERDDRRDAIGGGQKRPGTSQRGERPLYNESPPRREKSPSDTPYHYGKSRFDECRSPYRREFEASPNEPYHGGQSKAGGDFRSQLLELAMKEKQKLGLDKLDSPRDTSTALKAIQGYSGEGGQSPDSDRPESPPQDLYDDVPKPLFPISEKRGGARAKPDPGGGKWGDKFTSSFMPVDERKKAQEPIFPGVDDYDPRIEQKDSPKRGHQSQMTIPGLGMDENIDDEEAFLYGESETTSRPQEKRDYGIEDRVSSGSLESWSSQSRYNRAHSPDSRAQQKMGSKMQLRAEKPESLHPQGRTDRPEREDNWNRPEHRSQNRLDALDPRNVDRMDRPEPRAQSRFDSFEPQSQCRPDKSPDRSDLTIDLNLKFDRRRPGQQDTLLREDDKLFRDGRPSHPQRKQSLDDGDDLLGPRRPGRRRSRTPDLSPPRRPVAQFSSDPSIEEMKQELMQLKMMLNKEKAGIPDEHLERKRLRSPSGSDSYLRGGRSPSPGKRRRPAYSPEHRRYNSPPAHYRNRSPTDYRRPSPPSRRSDRSPYYRSPPRRYSPSPVNSLSPVSDRSHGRRRSWSQSPPPRPSRRSTSPPPWSRDGRLQQQSDVPAQQTFYNEMNVSQPYYEAANPPMPVSAHIPDLSVPPPSFGAPGMQPPNPYYGYQAPVPPNFMFPPPTITPVQLQQQQQKQQQPQQKQQSGPRSNLRVVPLQSPSSNVAQMSQANVPPATQAQAVKAEKMSPAREVKEERKGVPPSLEGKSCINSEELDNYLRLVELKDSQRDRLNVLKQEMVRLGKIQNEIMRRKQHERDGHKDPFLLESCSLYEDVKKQVLELNNAMEETSRKIYRIPQKVKLDALKRKQERDAADDSSDSSGIRFIYEDPRDHWCQSCNAIVANVNEVFKHLHSDKHKETIPTHERPWAEMEKQQPSSKTYQRTIVTNLKGVQFMVGMSGYYCKLCKVMCGDSAMARNHLFGTEHNQNYTKFILLNPFYERRWKMERDVALAHSVKERIKDKPPVPTSPALEQSKTSNTKSNKDEKQERIRKKSEELLRAEQESAKSVKELDDEAPPSRSTSSKDKSKEKAGIKLKLLKGQKTQKPAKPSPVVIIGKAPCFRPSFLSGKKATALSVAKKEAPVPYGPALPPDMMQAVAREEIPQDLKKTVMNPTPKEPNLSDIPLPVCAGPRKPKQLKSGVVEKKVEKFRPMTEEDLDLKLLGIERDDVEPIAPVKPPPAVVAKESDNVSQVPMDVEDSGDTEKAVACSAAQSVSKDCTVPMEIEESGARKVPAPINIGETKPPPGGGVAPCSLPKGNAALSENNGAGVNLSPAGNIAVTLKPALGTSSHVPVSTVGSGPHPGAKVMEQNVKQVPNVVTVKLQDTLGVKADIVVGDLKSDPVGKQTNDKSESGAETIRDASGDVVTPIVGFERGKPVVVKRTVIAEVSTQQSSKDAGAEVSNASAVPTATKFAAATSTNMGEQVQGADGAKKETAAIEINSCTPIKECVAKKLELQEKPDTCSKVLGLSTQQSDMLPGCASNAAQENIVVVECGNIATQSAGDSGTAPQQPEILAHLTPDIKQSSPAVSAPCLPEHGVHGKECDGSSVAAAQSADQPEETLHHQEMSAQLACDIKNSSSVPLTTCLPELSTQGGEECSNNVTVPTPSVDHSEGIVDQEEMPAPMISDVNDSCPVNTCEGASRIEAVSAADHTEHNVKEQETCDQLMSETKDGCTVQSVPLLEHGATVVEDGNAAKKLEGMPSTDNDEHATQEQGKCLALMSDVMDSGVVNQVVGENASRTEALSSTAHTEYNVKEQETCDQLMPETKDGCTVQSVPLLEHGASVVEDGNVAKKLEGMPSTDNVEHTTQEQGTCLSLMSDMKDSGAVNQVERENASRMETVSSTDNSQHSVREQEMCEPMMQNNKDDCTVQSTPLLEHGISTDEGASGAKKMEAISSTANPEVTVQEQGVCVPLMSEIKDSGAALSELPVSEHHTNMDQESGISRMDVDPPTDNSEKVIERQEVSTLSTSELKVSSEVLSKPPLPERRMDDQENSDSTLEGTATPDHSTAQVTFQAKDGSDALSSSLPEHNVDEKDSKQSNEAEVKSVDKQEDIVCGEAPVAGTDAFEADVPMHEEQGTTSISETDTSKSGQAANPASETVVAKVSMSPKLLNSEADHQVGIQNAGEAQVKSIDQQEDIVRGEAPVAGTDAFEADVPMHEEQGTTSISETDTSKSGQAAASDAVVAKVSLSPKMLSTEADHQVGIQKAGEAQVKSVDQQEDIVHGEAPVAGTDALEAEVPMHEEQGTTSISETDTSKSGQAANAASEAVVTEVSMSPKLLNTENYHQVGIHQADECGSMEMHAELQKEEIPRPVSGSDDKAQDAADIMSVDDCVRALDSLNSMATGASMEESSYIVMCGKTSNLSHVETAAKSVDQTGGKETCMDTLQNESLLPGDLSANDQPADLHLSGIKVETNSEQCLQRESSSSLGVDENNTVKQASQLSSICEGDATEDTSESKMADLDFAVVDECSEDNGETCMEVLDEVTNDEEGIIIVMDQA